MPRFRSLLALALLGCTATAADWPSWLGPNRDSASPEKVAPWKEAPKQLWKQPAGEAHSSPVVAGGKVYLFTKVANKEEEELTAYDAKKGDKLWSVSYERSKFSSFFGNGPRATPSVVDGRVYTFGSTGILTCFTADKGEKKWSVDTLKDFQAKNLFFGASSTPLVADGKIFVLVGGKTATLVALKQDNGEVVWKKLVTWKQGEKTIEDGASYSSPIITGEGKQRQLVTLTQQGVVSLDPATGDVNWQVPLKDKQFESSTTPVRSGDYVLASSVTFGALGIKLDSKDDKPTGVQEWKNAALNCYFSTPVAVGKEHIYIVTSGGSITSPVSNLNCVELKTGKVLWTKPKVGGYHAALVRTGDDKLLMLDDFGNLTLIEPNAEKFVELAQSKVCGKTWAHPALSDGCVFLRDEKDLMCLQLGK
jgi:outer membrane protein assembly factor BamB